MPTLRRPATTSELESLSRLVRLFILRSTTAAGSGHPTSALSATDLLVTLLFGGVFRADLNRPKHPNNDRLIFSKGHAAPLLYALYAAAGKVSPRELLTLRKFGSRLEGHPMPTFPYTEVPTGSLGQGLSIGGGMALAARFDKLSYRTWVLLGDSEMSEGSVWEAIQYAGFAKLSNLTAILDMNRLGQAGPTILGHDAAAYVRRLRGFGWKTITVDGHDIPKINFALRVANRERAKPLMVIAKTFKGRGVRWVENRESWHGKAIPKELLPAAIADLGEVDERIRGSIAKPRPTSVRVLSRRQPKSPSYASTKSASPREAFGNGLVRLAAAFPELVVLDAEVKNSTFTEKFSDAYPKRFLQMYISEQNAVGASVGLASRGKVPVFATFAAFLTRAHDQLRMAQYAGTHQVYAGTHVGVSIGQDGASQMGLEDIALFRSIQNSTVLYPSDAYSAERLLELALRGTGIIYLRLTRNPLPILYDAKTAFRLGGSHTLRRSSRDRTTIVAVGATLHEALAAHDELARRRINVRVIDLYSIKPLDAPTLRRAAQETKWIIVVEDHVQAGGIAEAVRSALGPLAGTVNSLCVTKIPRSGKPAELLRHQNIDRSAIVRAVLSGKR